MLLFDRILSGLLILGAIGHTLGVLNFYKGQPVPMFWALCFTGLIVLLAAINLLRAVRPTDRGMAWLAAVASFVFAGISVAFGFLVGNPADARAVSFALVSLGLAALGTRQALG